MVLRIAVLSNCQHESLAIALRALLPAADVTSLDLNALPADPAGRAQVAANLAAADHVISQDVAPDYGPLSTRALRAGARRFHLLPAFYFGGFHPDCVTVKLDDLPVNGPTGGLHSRIVIAAFLAGLSPEEASELFNTLVFARLGYFDALAEHSVLLIEKFAAYAIDLSNMLAKWRNAGCFMTSPNHPKMAVFLDLARIACAMMGLAPQADPVATSLRDPLAMYSTMPFLPEIAARCGMQAEGVYRDTLPAPPLSLPAFVQGSFAAFARTPLSCLRAAQGVAEAMAKLGLTDAPRPKRAMAAGPGAQCLLTWHGTVVRIEAASSLLVQEKPWPEGADGSDFAYIPVSGGGGAMRADILGGLDITPASMPGAVGITRRGRAMVAEAGRLAIPFRTGAAPQDQAFLPLSPAELADLRMILSRDWTWHGTARRAAAARIRLLPGFILDFGIFAINLAEARPARLPESDGDGFILSTSAGPITILAAPEAARGREIALLPEPGRRMPNEAGSIPEFRTKPRASWSLAPPDEILHPPVTASQRDAAWVFERCTWPGGLPSGLQHHAAALRRMPGLAVLLAPGLEGLLFDSSGAMASYPPVNLPRGAALPPGLRLEENAVLIEADGLVSAPLIDEPVAVCLSPAWSNADGWLIDVALRLHAMAPLLPRGARLLVPPGFAEAAPARVAMLDALGLGQWPLLEAPASICRLADAIWPSFPRPRGRPRASTSNAPARGAWRRATRSRASWPRRTSQPWSRRSSRRRR